MCALTARSTGRADLWLLRGELQRGAPLNLVVRAPSQMNSPDKSWENRLDALWSAIDRYEPQVFVEQIELLAAELPSGSAVGSFERASAQDSTGHSDLAVPLYRSALRAGLSGSRRRRATIQLASSVRNLGNASEAADLLFAEVNAVSDELDGAVQAFLALAFFDLGREREAVALGLVALSKYLPRYNRSLARYAGEIAATPRNANGGP